MKNEFEVLSPWATADPIPLRGITPRFDEMSGKKIGLYATSKRKKAQKAAEAAMRHV